MNKSDLVIILGSSSPRRIELIKKLGYKYKIIKPEIDERIIDETNNKEEYSIKEAILKAKAILSNYDLKENELLLTLDTSIIFNNKIYNKPLSLNKNIKMLEDFSNNTHQVISGYYLKYKDKEIINKTTTLVTFNNLTKEDILSYINQEKTLDKAGGYAIQDNQKYHLVKSIEGSFYNVIGFPIEDINKIINELIKE